MAGLRRLKEQSKVWGRLCSFFSGKVANPDPTDFSYRYGPYNSFNPNGVLDSSIDNTTNWSANVGGNLLVTYAYFSCNAFTLVCTGPLIAATVS